MKDQSLHNLVECKMAISTDPEERPPRVPEKEPDAPPSYQPADGPSTSSTLVPVVSETAGSSSATHSAYNHPSPAQHGQPSRGTRSTSNEISIPFYSNPPPAPDLPDRKPSRPAAPVSSKETGPVRPFACLTLHSNDKLGSTNFSSEITNELDKVIRAKWAKGIKQWAHEDGGWCWQLNGKPWSHGDLATPARELVLALLTRLSNLGYSLHTSLLSSPGSDKDSLIFRKTPRTVGAGRQFFAVCYYKSDKIKILDCPDEGIKEALNTAIKVWPEGVQSTKDKSKKSNNQSWKLKGTPWKTKSGDGDCVTNSRALLCAILEELENVGWELCGNVKLTKPDDNRDLDTWIFSTPLR